VDVALQILSFATQGLFCEHQQIRNQMNEVLMNINKKLQTYFKRFYSIFLILLASKISCLSGRMRCVKNHRISQRESLLVLK
jgi:hypothetical protein